MLDDPASSRLFLVTGPVGAGKTMWCNRIVEQARAQGFVVRGVLSPPVIVDQQKIGIDLLDLATGARRRLANRRDAASAGLVTQRWHFDEAVLQWGDEVLQAVEGCDLLVIDELGPLEFQRAEGWQAGLRLVEARRFRAACVVVRPSLLADALRRWPHAQILDVSQ